MFYQENHPGNLAKEIASAFDAAKTKMRISHEVNDVNFIMVKVGLSNQPNGRTFRNKHCSTEKADDRMLTNLKILLDNHKVASKQ